MVPNEYWRRVYDERVDAGHNDLRESSVAVLVLHFRTESSRTE